MAWIFGSAIEIGDRDEQQDRVAVLHNVQNTAHLLVIADGMGGHEDGALAAQTVIDIATKLFAEEHPDSPARFLSSICSLAHQEISLLAGNRFSAPGSTCVLLYLTDTDAYWAHVGDSRLYQFNGGLYRGKTVDHSVAELLKQRSENIEISAPQNQLYMCLGGKNEVVADPGYGKVADTDLFILCSDGLWGQTDIVSTIEMASEGSPDEVLMSSMLTQAKKQGNGQSDNICIAWAYRQQEYKSGGLGWLQKIIAFVLPSVSHKI